MADVKMTLKEYNQLYDELSQLKAALKSLLTPSLSSYEKTQLSELASDGGTFTLRSEARLDNPIVAQFIREKYEGLVEEGDIIPNHDPDFEHFAKYSQIIDLVRLDFPEPDSCRHCGELFENTERHCSGKAYCIRCCEHCGDYRGGNCYYYKKAHPTTEEE